MAGDWIKYRAELRDDPRFLTLCNELIHPDDESHPGLYFFVFESDELTDPHPQRGDAVTKALHRVTLRSLRAVTLSQLLLVWARINSHCSVDGDDAICTPMTLFDLGTVAEIEGFGEAMAAAGWVEEIDDNTLRFPNFLKYNQPACLRREPKSNAQRQREYRERRRAERERNISQDFDVTKVTKCNAEKRREDKSINIRTPPTPPKRFEAKRAELPAELNTPEFRNAWSLWCAYRSEARKPLTSRSVAMQLKKLAAVGPDRAIEALELSIANGWTGVFPEKQARNGKTSTEEIGEWLAGGQDDS